MAWIDVLAETDLAAEGKAVVRHDGRQILLLKAACGIVACANRCPHEGYPLSEGALDADGVLTCNWHNWKFDLASGKTLIGGDVLPRHPVRVEGGRILLDLTPPDPAERRRAILAGIAAALADRDEQRLVRETARLAKLGADPADAVRHAILWAAERLEFGTTHALAGAPDWLALHDRSPVGSAERLAALGEILGHLGEDARNGTLFAFAEAEAVWDQTDFRAAVERQDEATAVALLRGALAAGLGAEDLAPALYGAALAHYADFGHSLIYTAKTLALIDRLGGAVALPLLLMLARSLCYATREDLVPEFRDYAARLTAWGTGDESSPPLEAALLRRMTPKPTMALVAAWGRRHRPAAIFQVLVEAAARQLLQVEAARLVTPDAKLTDSIGWLDFTHALTFAEAALTATGRDPGLWPAVLLQLACFVGRNAGYVDEGFDATPWAVGDIDRFLQTETAALLDHGRDRFIVSVHLLKTLCAGAGLIAALPDRASLLAAALNRFLHAPIKGRHVLRTARQMAALVETE